jgi:hypothetical protein
MHPGLKGACGDILETAVPQAAQATESTAMQPDGLLPAALRAAHET